jgi:hypothetical protein
LSQLKNCYRALRNMGFGIRDPEKSHTGSRIWIRNTVLNLLKFLYRFSQICHICYEQVGRDFNLNYHYLAPSVCQFMEATAMMVSQRKQPSHKIRSTNTTCTFLISILFEKLYRIWKYQQELEIQLSSCTILYRKKHISNPFQSAFKNKKNCCFSLYINCTKHDTYKYAQKSEIQPLTKA